MTQDTWIKTHCEINKAFEGGRISEVDNATLQLWLENICTGVIPNENIRHVEVVRGLTINHIRMDRTIRELEATMRELNSANAKSQRLMEKLQWAAYFFGVVQAVVAVISLLH